MMMNSKLGAAIAITVLLAAACGESPVDSEASVSSDVAVEATPVPVEATPVPVPIEASPLPWLTAAGELMEIVAVEAGSLADIAAIGSPAVLMSSCDSTADHLAAAVEARSAAMADPPEMLTEVAAMTALAMDLNVDGFRACADGDFDAATTFMGAGNTLTDQITESLRVMLEEIQ